MAAGILQLLEQAKAHAGLTDEQVALAAGIPTRTKAETIRNLRRRRHGMHVTLVDWVLAQTVFAGDPWPRAAAELQRLGLTPDQVAVMAALVEQFTGGVSYAMTHPRQPAGPRAAGARSGPPPPTRLETLAGRRTQLSAGLPPATRTALLDAARELLRLAAPPGGPPASGSSPASADAAATREGSAAAADARDAAKPDSDP